MNVFDFAMKMELDGKAYYEKFAAETTIVGLKAIFTMLAADEQKHYELVLAMKEGSKKVMTDSTVLEKARNVFQDLVADKFLAGGLRQSLDGYKHAMKVEADSVRLYVDMAEKEKNEEVALILLKIAEEEKKHYSIMENLYDYTLAPQNYLAWGEFSNLKEF